MDEVPSYTRTARYGEISWNKRIIAWASVHNHNVVLTLRTGILVRIARHIVGTVQGLHIRAVVLFVGDKYEQQPIQSRQGRTFETENIFKWDNVSFISHKITMSTRHRLTDKNLLQIVNHLRVLLPTNKLLQRLTHERIICSTKQFDSESILQFYSHTALCYFLLSLSVLAVTSTVSSLQMIFRTPLSFLDVSWTTVIIL